MVVTVVITSYVCALIERAFFCPYFVVHAADAFVHSRKQVK